jgi:hypothetical protein
MDSKTATGLSIRSISHWIHDVNKWRPNDDELELKLSKHSLKRSKKTSKKIHPLPDIGVKNRALPSDSFKNERVALGDNVAYAETDEIPNWPSPHSPFLNSDIQPAKRTHSLKRNESKKTNTADEEAETIQPIVKSAKSPHTATIVFTSLPPKVTINSPHTATIVAKLTSLPPKVTINSPHTATMVAKLTSLPPKVTINSPARNQARTSCSPQSPVFKSAVTANPSPIYYTPLEPSLPTPNNSSPRNNQLKAKILNPNSMPRLDINEEMMSITSLEKRWKSLHTPLRPKIGTVGHKASLLVVGESIRGNSGWMRVDEIIKKSNGCTTAKVTRLLDDVKCVLKIVSLDSGIENLSALLELEFQTLQKVKFIPNVVQVLEIGEILDLRLKYLCTLDFGGESLATISRNRISGKVISDEEDVLPSGFHLSEVLHVFIETNRFLTRLHNSGMVSDIFCNA